MKRATPVSELYLYDYFSSNIDVKNISYKTISEKKLKCWFCNDRVETLIGFCENCKYHRLTKFKNF